MGNAININPQSGGESFDWVKTVKVIPSENAKSITVDFGDNALPSIVSIFTNPPLNKAILTEKGFVGYAVDQMNANFRRRSSETFLSGSIYKFNSGGSVDNDPCSASYDQATNSLTFSWSVGGQVVGGYEYVAFLYYLRSDI